MGNYKNTTGSCIIFLWLLLTCHGLSFTNVKSKASKGSASSMTPPQTSELIRPVEDCNEFELYDQVVQKTYGRYPLVISHGKGCVLYDTKNNKSYLDFVAGIATCCLGHANPTLTE